MFILAIVVVSNMSEIAKAAELTQALVTVDPLTQSNVAGSLDGYTPLIENDSSFVDESNTTIVSAEGFAANIAPVETKITARVEPLPDNSKDTVFYIVRANDTLTGLGSKFGVKLTTLQYLNSLTTTTIKPGQRLKIPPRGYEVPASQIAAKAKAATAATAKASTKTTKQTYNGDYAAGGDVTLITPVAYSYISQYFMQHGHTGVDFVCNVGTPVHAAADGVVIQISTGWSGGYGNEIVISHGGGVATRYGHLSKIYISVGETVNQGDVIGLSGSTGRSTGPHLHFEKIVNGRVANPL